MSHLWVQVFIYLLMCYFIFNRCWIDIYSDTKHSEFTVLFLLTTWMTRANFPRNYAPWAKNSIALMDFCSETYRNRNKTIFLMLHYCSAMRCRRVVIGYRHNHIITQHASSVNAKSINLSYTEQNYIYSLRLNKIVWFNSQRIGRWPEFWHNIPARSSFFTERVVKIIWNSLPVDADFHSLPGYIWQIERMDFLEFMWFYR